MATLQLDAPAPPRRSVSPSCDLHPSETFTGFCAACLRERLQGLESSAAAASAPGRKSTSAIRSLFARPFAGGGSSASGAAEPPDLRRCKSFSCGRGGDALATAAADEPQRRSCDVRGRSTQWALFHQDDRVRDGTAFGAFPASSSAATAALSADVLLQPHCVVPENLIEEDIPVVMEEEESDEIIPVVESVVAMDISGEMEPESVNAVPAPEGSKPMNDHNDEEALQAKKASPKDLKEIAGSFWVAASVFSNKWQKWRRKQKHKEAAVSKASAAAMPPPEKPPKPSFLLCRRCRARGDGGADLAGSRWSCDTDPRFSLDAARMSVDDAGFSWDEPRASWDRYLFGAGGVWGGGVGRAPLPLSRLPPILSVMEDIPTDIVERSDGQIPVEDDADFEPPSGSLQTRDCYLHSSSRRRRSLDRTSSVRRPSFDVGQVERTSSVRRPSFEVVQLERTSSVRRPSFEVTNEAMAEPAVVNGKEPPIGVSEFYHFHHAEDLLDRGFSSNSLIEDISASLEAALSGPAKKPRHRWRNKAWSLWGLIRRRGGGGPSDIADRSFSEPWPDLRVRAASPKMHRCNSNLSERSSFSSNSGGLGSYVDAASGSVKRSREQEHVQVERNRSARYSPGRADNNGMLRFYLTPMRSGR